MVHDLLGQAYASIKHNRRRTTLTMLGMAWGMETIVDETLQHVPEVYIEAGDHEQLLKLSARDFNELMRGARHAHFVHIMPH